MFYIVSHKYLQLPVLKKDTKFKHCFKHRRAEGCMAIADSFIINRPDDFESDSNNDSEENDNESPSENVLLSITPLGCDYTSRITNLEKLFHDLPLICI